MFRPVPGGSLNLLSLAMMVGGIRDRELDRLGENMKALLNLMMIGLP